jgi:hypothetical protein
MCCRHLKIFHDGIPDFTPKFATFSTFEMTSKYYNKKIDVKDVEAFLGMLTDVDANKGVMISLKGYSTAAINRAHNDSTDLELEVFSFAELKQFQAVCAIPFSGQHGVLLSAPFGWIIDGARRQGAVACLYPRGFDLKNAQKAKEWMYVNFWEKGGSINSLEALLKHQELYLRKDFPEAQFSYHEGPYREKTKTIIREVIEQSYPTPEYTGFIDFDDFIFFCVLFSPTQQLKKNLRKLEHVLTSSLPINIEANTSLQLTAH